MFKEFKLLKVEIRDETVWVTIDRPGDRNSINSSLMAEMTTLFHELGRGDFRAAVLTGAGDEYFVGGADGIEMMRLGPPEAGSFSTRIQDLFNLIEAGPLITVAAINGLCFGGGFELALACDFRVAGEKARLGLPEVKVGLIPGGGGTQRLTRLAGIGRALEMILGGRLYKPGPALDMGLIHLVVKDEDLRQGVEHLLAPILRQPPYVLPLAKQAVYASQAGGIDHGLRVESQCFGRCLEHRFFPDLMRHQLEEGILRTTEDVSDILKEKSK